MSKFARQNLFPTVLAFAVLALLLGGPGRALSAPPLSEDVDRLTALRLAGITGDRSQMPASIAALGRPDDSAVTTALLASAQMGATAALPARRGRGSSPQRPPLHAPPACAAGSQFRTGSRIMDSQVSGVASLRLIQFPADDGRPAGRAAAAKLREIRAHRRRYSASGFAGLFDVIRSVEDPAQTFLVGSFTHDQNWWVAFVAQDSLPSIARGQREQVLTGY